MDSGHLLRKGNVSLKLFRPSVAGLILGAKYKSTSSFAKLAFQWFLALSSIVDLGSAKKEGIDIKLKLKRASLGSSALRYFLQS
jgi:hypothetical protein